MVFLSRSFRYDGLVPLPPASVVDMGFLRTTQAIGVAAATVDASGGIATLIGVGISASLLPPAVNCGMLWVSGVSVNLHATAGKLLWCFIPRCWHCGAFLRKHLWPRWSHGTSIGYFSRSHTMSLVITQWSSMFRSVLFELGGCSLALSLVNVRNSTFLSLGI